VSQRWWANRDHENAWHHPPDGVSSSDASAQLLADGPVGGIQLQRRAARPGCPPERGRQCGHEFLRRRDGGGTTIHSVAAQPGGRVVVGGMFPGINGAAQFPRPFFKAFRSP